MVRPRWHDAVIIAAIVGLVAVGVWALWWDDVRSALGLPSEAVPAQRPGQVSAGSATT